MCAFKWGSIEGCFAYTNDLPQDHGSVCMPFHLVERINVRLRQMAGVQILVVVHGIVVVVYCAGRHRCCSGGAGRLRRAGRLSAILERAVVAGQRDARLGLQRQASGQAAGKSVACAGESRIWMIFY